MVVARSTVASVEYSRRSGVGIRDLGFSIRTARAPRDCRPVLATNQVSLRALERLCVDCCDRRAGRASRICRARYLAESEPFELADDDRRNVTSAVVKPGMARL